MNDTIEIPRDGESGQAPVKPVWRPPTLSVLPISATRFGGFSGVDGEDAQPS